MECTTLNNINNHHPHVHFINNNSSLVLTLRNFENEEKLVALLVYSSFIRVALVVSGMVPYSLVVVVLFAQMRSDSGMIPESLQHGRVMVVVTSPD